MVALLVLLTVLVFLTIDYFVQRGRSEVPVEVQGSKVSSMEPLSYRTPAGVYFDTGHTWLFLEESGEAKIGVNEFAESVVGKIDRFTTIPEGKPVRRGDMILKLWHGGRCATFRSPVDGVISEINTEALAQNARPGAEGKYTDRWLYRVTPEDVSQFPRSMHIGSDAKTWLSREVQRLKVFLATIVPEHPVLGTIMQDGGLPNAGLIDHLGEVEWTKLQERFFGIDPNESDKARSSDEN